MVYQGERVFCGLKRKKNQEQVEEVAGQSQREKEKNGKNCRPKRKRKY